MAIRGTRVGGSIHITLALIAALMFARTSASAFSGGVFGGGPQTAVGGSTITFYAVGSGGYGKGASVLETTTTNAVGSFNLASYTCPSASVQTYITATGGNAGSGSNSAIGMMALTGQCSSLSNSSFVTVNELTTVAAQWALAQFIDSTGKTIGSSATNSRGLSNAAQQAMKDLVVSVGTNTSNTGVPAGFLPSAAQCSSSSPPVNCDGLERLDTLANMISPCVKSAGPSSTQCTLLFSRSGTPSTATTLAAAHMIAIRPAANVAALFALQGTASSAPFQPDLATAPTAWTLALDFTGGGLNGPAAIAIDGIGNAWVANDGGAVVKFAPGGTLLSGSSGYTGGGLDHCFGIAVDGSGNAWLTNKYNSSTNGSVTELSSSGRVLSGANGYTAGGIDYPIALTRDRSGNVWVANYGNASITRDPQSASALNFIGGGLSFPASIAIDNSGNAWTANFGNNSVTELGPGGTRLSGSGGYTGGGLDGPTSIAVDARGHAWIANYYGNSISELDASGVAVSGSPFTGGGLSGPATITLDGAGNVWVANYLGDSITELQGSAGVAPGSLRSGTSGCKGVGLATPNGMAIDSAGNLWAANFNDDGVTEFVSVATPVKTPLVGPPTEP